MLVYPFDDCAAFHSEDYFSLTICWVRMPIWNLISCVSLSLLYLITWPVSTIPAECGLWPPEASLSFWVAGSTVPSPEYQEWHLPGCALLLSWGRSLCWTCMAQEGEGQRVQTSRMPLPQPVTLLVDPESPLVLSSIVSQLGVHGSARPLHKFSLLSVLAIILYFFLHYELICL